ncbi:MAG: hypothetical protein HZC03_00855 [Candidatus Lloydbacteria bacterium]|nr:hypothetical protein [Candidatus Lloydbacteria bacterium]
MRYGKALLDSTHVCMCGACREYIKTAHRLYANDMLLSLAFAILFIEIKVRLGGFADRAPELFWTHLSFAVPFLCALLLLRFKITGTKNLSLHKKIAYTSIVLFIGTAITGSMLFFSR